MSTDEEDLEFAKWLEEVEQGLWGMAGMTLSDFPDFDFVALFEVGSTPSQASDAALLSIEFSRFE